MTNRYTDFSLSFSHFMNPKVQSESHYNHQDILSLEGFKLANNEITSWDNYKPTPLHSFDDMAKETGVSSIFYKDEYPRFSLKSFKALGGAYKDHTSKLTVCCATDGNHGRSVAWGAQQFGCNCEIYIHRNVSSGREKAIAKYGAIVNRIQGNYDDSVRIAAEVADANGYTVVSDTSYEGYTDIPKDVMQGYTVMVDEAMKQMNDTPTHVFLQGGVGGFPAAVVSFLQESLECPPIFIVVEPVNADCLFQSALNGEPTAVHGELDTIMAGLACGEVSVLAWKILQSHVPHFMSITDESIPKAMQLLANRETPIIAGESAITGLAGFLIACNDANLKSKLMINENSKVLFFGTEGDTDEEMYEQLVGRTSEQVLIGAE
jgi:diaminopropionate ammonia-lyase